MVDIDVLRKEWYRLNAISTEGMNPRDLGFHTGMKSGIIKAMNLLAGAEQMSDKGYEISTLEKQTEFAKKRNYDIGDCV
jgi:hypothetical protein